MVLAQSLFITLKRQRPDRQIDVLAPDALMPLLERMPEVDRRISSSINFDRLELEKRYRLGQGLKPEGYDQAIVLPDSMASALIPFFAEIPERTGWRGSMRFFLLNDIRLFSRRRYPEPVQRYVALAYEPGAELSGKAELAEPELHIDRQRAGPLWLKCGLDRSRPILALCPGAGAGTGARAAAGWPGDHFAAVARQYIENNWQVVLFGLEEDARAAQAVLELLDEGVREQCLCLAGRTGLADTVDTLAAATAVVANDNAMVDIAAALKRPVVVVYGPDSSRPVTEFDNVAASLDSLQRDDQ